MGVTCNDIKSSRKIFEHIDIPDVFIYVNAVFICFVLGLLQIEFHIHR